MAKVDDPQQPFEAWEPQHPLFDVYVPLHPQFPLFTGIEAYVWPHPEQPDVEPQPDVLQPDVLHAVEQALQLRLRFVLQPRLQQSLLVAQPEPQLTAGAILVL